MSRYRKIIGWVLLVFAFALFEVIGIVAFGLWTSLAIQAIAFGLIGCIVIGVNLIE